MPLQTRALKPQEIVRSEISRLTIPSLSNIPGATQQYYGS